MKAAVQAARLCSGIDICGSYSMIPFRIVELPFLVRIQLVCVHRPLFGRPLSVLGHSSSVLRVFIVRSLRSSSVLGPFIVPLSYIDRLYSSSPSSVHRLYTACTFKRPFCVSACFERKRNENFYDRSVCTYKKT